MSVVGVATVAVSAYGAYSANKNAKAARKSGARQSAAALEFQKEQAEMLEKQKEIYRDMEFENPYEGVTNPYANMENVWEDATVNRQQAEFESEQGAQQRADILRGLRGAAGGAGVASLAQALANQGQLQAQQISASIGQQEARNEQLRAQGAGQIQQLERQGVGATDMAERGGFAMMQQAEMDRQATLLGMSQAGAAGANTALQQAYSNQMYGNMYGAQGQADAIAGLGKSIASLGD